VNLGEKVPLTCADATGAHVSLAHMTATHHPEERGTPPAPTSLPAHIEDAIHTAVSEIPDAHPDDIADCVCGMIGIPEFDTYEAVIVARIASLR
jgi:hypothetical protein